MAKIMNLQLQFTFTDKPRTQRLPHLERANMKAGASTQIIVCSFLRSEPADSRVIAEYADGATEAAGK